MRRLLTVLAVVVAAAAGAVVATGASGGDGSGYRVRALFHNAFSVIPGLDVRIGGVRVGQVVQTDVSRDKKAVVVLQIDEPGFQDFRADAECAVRPQSLIGEKFIECTPTQPRAAGERVPPPLRVVPDGEEGAGQRLLPASNTTKPIDLDLVNEIMRLPQRQRFSIILSELGTGLAARGPELREAVRNANPALKETNRVVALLARQRDTLAQLAEDGDRILGPLARDREAVAGFVSRAREVAAATASRSDALERSVERLPAFLRELRPTMTRLAELSDEGVPLLADARAAAPATTRVLRALGPFSEASAPALDRLGDASLVGRDALLASRPILQETRRFAAATRPVAEDLQAVLSSIRETGGIERAMDFFFYQVAAINGFDALGHYLRANIILNNCTTYATTPQPGCLAKFVADEEDEEEESRSARAATTPAPKPVPVTGRPAASAPAPDPAARRAAAAAAEPGRGGPAPETAPLLDFLLGHGP